MTAYGNIDSALAGLLVGDAEVVSRVAGNECNFGMPAVVFSGDAEKVFQYVLDKSVLTFSADFVASNSIAVSVDGTAITPVVFDTNHATTFAAVVAAINGLANVTATAGAGRSINISMDDHSAITVVAAVTLGASQATSSQVLSCTGSVFGVFPRVQKVGGQFNQYDNTPIVREGEMWVMTADAVVANATAYLVAASGVFTDDSSGNVTTGYVFRTATSGAALARVEIIK
jgi:hypothetical protein